MKITEYLKLIRVKHWIKNFIIVIPAFFGATMLNAKIISSLIPGFFIFSFYSSAIYVMNDMIDVEHDRKHPEKCKRPLASGSVTKIEACAIVFVLLSCAVLLSVTPPYFGQAISA